VSLGTISLLIALIYKILPEAHVAWRDVWVGAPITAALFLLGKYLIGIYIGKASVASAFGAAGSLAVLLVWVYYSTQLIFLAPSSRASTPTASATRWSPPGGPSRRRRRSSKPAPYPDASPTASDGGAPARANAVH